MAVDVHPRTSLRVLTRDQQYFYQENGYLLLESIISEDWIAQLREATEEMLERSRALTESNAVFDLERNHTAAQPRLRRITSPVDQHETYWQYASQSLIADIAADLVGP